jgi:hypothetical protein
MQRKLQAWHDMRCIVPEFTCRNLIRLLKILVGM